MNYDTMQWMIVVFTVLASALHAVRVLAPDALRRIRKQVALQLIRADRPAPVRRLGRLFAPLPQVGSGQCGGCNSCAPQDAR